MTFSAMNAAFEGFRITVRRPWAVLVWSGVYFVTSVAGSWLMTTLAGEAVADYARVAAGGERPTPEQAMALAQAAWRPWLATVAMNLAAGALLANAVVRASASPVNDAFGFLRLGARDLLQIVNLFGWGAIVAAAYLALAFAGTIPGGIAAMLAPALVPPVVIAFVGLGTLLVMGRLILAGPITATEGGIGLGRSWSRTKGRSWAMVGALAAALAFSLVVLALIGVIGVAVMVGIAGDFETVQAMIQGTGRQDGPFTPLSLAYNAVIAVISGLTTAITFGVGVDIHRQLGAAPADAWS